MNAAIDNHYMLPATVPPWLVIGMAVGAIAVWVAAHGFSRNLPARRWGQAVAFLVRLAIGVVAVLAVAQALLRYLVLATNWPMAWIAFAGALALEIVLAFYRLERRTVSRRAGWTLAALRVSIIVLVITMLAQPVWRWEVDKTVQRYVAVLLDTSASMHIADTQLSASEKLRMAEGLVPGSVNRPYALDATADDIEKVRSDLAAQADWLVSLAGPDSTGRRRQISDRRANLQATLISADKKLGEAAAAVAKPLGGGVKLEAAVATALQDVRQTLTTQAGPRVKEAIALTSRENAANIDRQREPLLQALRLAAASLADAEAKVVAANEGLDEAQYAALPADQRARVDSLAARKRLAVARDILAPAAPSAASASSTAASAGPLRSVNLLEKLGKQYTVKMWTFAAAPAEVNPRAFIEEVRAGGPPLGDASALPADLQMTDLAAVFDKAAAEMAGKPLSGILLLSDGRDTTPRSMDPLLARLAARQVPVSAIVFGGEKPPMDAGILAVDAPETVAIHDRFLANVEVKLDGLKGKDVHVALTDQDKAVDTQTIHVPTDSFRTRVQLADEPTTLGLHHFAIDVQKFEGEAMTSNNAFPLSVMVADDRTKLLVIEGRPSWEFRYIKNLFSGRDRTVALQYVLLEPDRIDGVPALAPVEASASRPAEDVEATALPKDEAEWMKFDAILLGDVPPKFLSAEQIKILHRFVTERGGTLIVDAGPRYMPHAYEGTPLADLLPVAIRRTPDPAQAPNALQFAAQQTATEPYVPAPEKSFRIALTAEGRESVILRQKTSPLENQEVWDSLPDLYWRHPMVKAKEAATILAYALPPDAPAFLKLTPPAAPGAAATPSAAPGAMPSATPAAPSGSPSSSSLQRSASISLRPGEVGAAELPPARPGDARSADQAASAVALNRERRDYERDHALIAYHNVAMGKVMFLATDHTWRLRYRVGDTYHHRLWGQILRWATANKLPAGTDTVKLGTDHSRYPPHTAVRVQAKVARKDFTINASDVAVNVFAGDALLLHKKLEYVEGSSGMYAGDLGDFPGGTYRVELDAPAARATLTEQHADKVATEFSVDPSTPAEQADLAANRGFLRRLTSQTGGLMVDPSKAERVLETLGPPTEHLKDAREVILWNSWLLLVTIILLASAKWLLRKKVGLA